MKDIAVALISAFGGIAAAAVPHLLSRKGRPLILRLVVGSVTAVVLALAFVTRPAFLFPARDPRILHPQTMAGLKGLQQFRCELPLISARPSIVHLWAVPYRPNRTEFNNGPALHPALQQTDLAGYVWEGEMNVADVPLDLQFGQGGFLLCTASFASVPDRAPNDVSNDARESGRAIDYQ